MWLRVDFQCCFFDLRIRTECSEHVKSFIDADWAYIRRWTLKKTHHWKTASRTYFQELLKNSDSYWQSITLTFRLSLNETFKYLYICNLVSQTGVHLAKKQKKSQWNLTHFSVKKVHQPFYISICISTLPTQHTTFISKLIVNCEATPFSI